MPYPGDAVSPPTASELTRLRTAFPAFRIWREATAVQTRLVAVRRHYTTRPYAVITGDPGELRTTLAAAQHREHE